ncbi:MAG TPA: Crp/Fnr family transcriptional regulator [Casimicrobiaceae bacterium]|nr:Crp/Fnr family transcriptional regulator [Casimicrobiaceae bacterium]
MARYQSAAANRNRLLARLPRADYQRLLPRLEAVRLFVGDVLYQPGEPQSHLYFPTSSVVSLVYTMKDGAMGEMGIVGRDGAVGMALFMGGGTRPNRALVQIGGDALRLSAKALRSELKRSEALETLLLRYTQALLTQISQTAVCNCLHPLEQRLCRWLLLCDDRAGPGELALTHALLGAMLGVRRETVTAAARKLRAAKLIGYRRGRIAVVNRRGLESRVCECYEVVRRETDRLLGGDHSAPRALLQL